MTQQSAIIAQWVSPEGEPLTCREKHQELSQLIDDLTIQARDALDDALLMGCSEIQFRRALEDAVCHIQPTVKER